MSPFQLPGVALEDENLQQKLDALAALASRWDGLLFTGVGAPTNVVVASPPALYLRVDGGAGSTLYVKESGVQTSAGWTAK